MEIANEHFETWMLYTGIVFIVNIIFVAFGTALAANLAPLMFGSSCSSTVDFTHKVARLDDLLAEFFSHKLHVTLNHVMMYTIFVLGQTISGFHFCRRNSIVSLILHLLFAGFHLAIYFSLSMIAFEDCNLSGPTPNSYIPSYFFARQTLFFLTMLTFFYLLILFRLVFIHHRMSLQRPSR